MHGVELRQEVRVFLQFLHPLDAHLVEEGDRVAVRFGPQCGVDAFEQVAGAGVPAPPEVARKLFEGVQPLGQRLVDHHAVPDGFLDEKLLAHEVDLLGFRAAVEHGAVGADDRTLDRLGVGLFVGREEVLPERRQRDFIGRGVLFVDVFFVQQAETQQRIGDLRLDLLVVVVVAADDLHAGVLALLVDPDAEPGQRRGDRRDGEGHRLQRGVAPRLVVGGENRDVHAHEQFVVILVEDAVGLVEVRGDEDHLHLRSGIGEVAVLQRVHDGVPRRVFKVVGRMSVLACVDGLRRVGQMSLQIEARAAVAGRHGDVGQHLAPETVRGGELLERLDEDVDALVAEFVAAAGSDDQRVAREFFAQAGLGHRDHRPAGFVAFGVVLLAGPYEVVLEAVGRHAVRFAPQQVFAFVGRDVAHRQECVVVGGGHLLDRVFGRDVELARQLVGVEFREVVVERQAVAGDAAAHDRGVGGEHRGDVGGVFAQVQPARGGHPLVEMRDSLLGRRAEGLDVGGDHDACGPSEQHRLDVVPLARDRVHVVRFPEAFEYFVLAGDQRREIDQHHRRLALDFPAADADADAFVVEALAPGLQLVGVLLELRVDALVREVGTQQDVAVCEFAGDGLRFGRNDGVDAADLVAYFPTYFEQQIGGVFGIAHILMLICNFRDEPKKNSAAKVTLIFILNNRSRGFLKIFNNNLTFQFHLVAVSGSVSKNVSITASETSIRAGGTAIRPAARTSVRLFSHGSASRRTRAARSLPNSLSASRRSMPSAVRSRVITYSLKRSRSVRVSASAGVPPMYSVTEATFQWRSRPSNEWAAGPMPRYFTPCQ